MTAPVEPALQQLSELVARVARTLQTGDDAAGRAQAAADVAQLEAALSQTPQGAPAGFDLRQVGEALHLLGAWLRTPTPANEAAAEHAVTELQATMGPLVGWDPAREDAARRAQYRQEARAALDEIFGGKPDKR